MKRRTASMKPTSSLDRFHKVTLTSWKGSNEDVGFMEAVPRLIFRNISKHFELFRKNQSISKYFEIFRNIKRRTVSMKPTSSLDRFHKVTLTSWRGSNEDVGLMEKVLRLIFQNISKHSEIFRNITRYFQMLRNIPKYQTQNCFHETDVLVESFL